MSIVGITEVSDFSISRLVAVIEDAHRAPVGEDMHSRGDLCKSRDWELPWFTSEGQIMEPSRVALSKVGSEGGRARDGPNITRPSLKR